MRILILALAALLLTACKPIAAPPPLPTPSPTPDPVALFKARYAALEAPYDALAAQMETFAFDSPEWRAETVRLAQEWRAAIEALRDTPQPEGDTWAAAWPVLQQALGEYLYVAGAVENAATANDPTLIDTARGRLVDGVNLMYEAMRLLEDD